MSSHQLMWCVTSVSIWTLTVKKHVNRLTSSCFFQLRRLHQIRRATGSEVTERLVLVNLSKLEYSSAARPGRQQTTSETSSACTERSRSSCHKHRITRSHHIVLKDLHWLPVNQRINYKLCLMMHQSHIQQCPDCMRDLVTSTATCAARSRLCSVSGLSYRNPVVRT